jgi:hypothetical protein
MTATIAPTMALETPTGTASDRVTRVARLGGIGGLVFTGTILAQNLLRASAPANDASPEKIISYYADHRAVSLALAALFPIGAAGIATFVGSLVSRARGSARTPAIIGGLSAAALLAMFAIVTATELAMSTYVHRGAPDPSVVSALWLTHMSVFGVNETFIAITLVGLTTACVKMGVVRPIWQKAGLVGAAALGIGAACTPAILNVSPVFGLALAGFLVWGVFVVAASISLLRRPATD